MPAPNTLPEWLNVSRETFAKLEAFLSLLLRWNGKINLISATTAEAAWVRHILDSAQLWLIPAARSGLWVDMGSGGGFPGLVIAILAQEQAPELRLLLVEADKRKSAFLRVASQELGLSVEVRSDRVEQLPPMRAQVVSARAFAPLHSLLSDAQRHLDANGVAIFPKGETAKSEVTEAQKRWQFSMEEIASKSHPGSVVLKVWDIVHV